MLLMRVKFGYMC